MGWDNGHLSLSLTLGVPSVLLIHYFYDYYYSYLYDYSYTLGLSQLSWCLAWGVIFYKCFLHTVAGSWRFFSAVS